MLAKEKCIFYDDGKEEWLFPYKKIVDSETLSIKKQKQLNTKYEFRFQVLYFGKDQVKEWITAENITYERKSLIYVKSYVTSKFEKGVRERMTRALVGSLNDDNKKKLCSNQYKVGTEENGDIEQ